MASIKDLKRAAEAERLGEIRLIVDDVSQRIQNRTLFNPSNSRRNPNDDTWLHSKFLLRNLLNKMPKNVEWSKLSEYEKTDMTIGSQELACAAGGCEIQ